MKKILISINPKWVKRILNGDKTIEVRKNAPKCELPCEVYIYCTKGSPYLYDLFNHQYSLNKIEPPNSLNGLVVAKFTLNKVELIRYGTHGIGYYPTETPMNEMAEKSCLYFDEVDKYLKRKDGYAWHIDQKSLVIFDKPKELKEFKHRIHLCPLRCDNNFVPSFCKDHCKHNKDPERLDVWCDRVDKWCEPLTKAPQSWCYCEVEE